MQPKLVVKYNQSKFTLIATIFNIIMCKLTQVGNIALFFAESLRLMMNIGANNNE